MAQQLVHTATVKLHNGYVHGCAISPDGTLVATGCNDSSVHITDIATQAIVYTAWCDHYVRNVAWSPDGTHLVAVTDGGGVFQVKNNNSHTLVYKINNSSLYGCAFSVCGILAVGGNDRAVTVLDPSDNYAVIQTFTGFANNVWCVAFSPNGSLLAVGCEGGHMYIYGMTNGMWTRVSYIKHHSSRIKSLCFSPSGRMLLATSDDKTASVWNVPFGTMWPSTPHVTFKGHTDLATSGAFLGIDSYAITGSHDSSLAIWRTIDGVQTETHQCGKVASLSYHAASGTIVLGLEDGQVGLWQTAPRVMTALQDSQSAHACVRERLAEAQAQVNSIKATLDQADSGLRQKMKREADLQSSIANLEAKLASEKKALEELQNANYIQQAREYKELVERRDTLLGIIHTCTQTLDSLTDCLDTSGLEDVRGETFREWLCDIGLGKLQTALKDIDGRTLTMLNASDVMDYGVAFSDAAALQLKGYIAHYNLGSDKTFTAPSGTVLAWTVEQTANWIKTLGDPYACLAAAGWHGAALCSLSMPRIIEASKGALRTPDAVMFLTYVRTQRNQASTDKEEIKDAWATMWTGTSTIENQVCILRSSME